MKRLGLLACALIACHARKEPVAKAEPAGERIYALALPDADFQLDLRPHELERDRQRVSLGNAAAEGASVGLGKVLSGSERVLIVTRVFGAETEVGMALIGTPASLGVDDVVGERGERLLERCVDDPPQAVVAPRSGPESAAELPVPCFFNRTSDGVVRRLYLVETRQWFVAMGARAIAHAEQALRSRRRASAPESADDSTLWQARYRGESLRRRVPKLRAGPLAPLAEGLHEVRVERHRGSDITFLFADYHTAAAAEEAEPLASRVLGAWRRSGESPRGGALERRGAQLVAQLRGELSAEEATP